MSLEISSQNSATNINQVGTKKRKVSLGTNLLMCSAASPVVLLGNSFLLPTYAERAKDKSFIKFLIDNHSAWAKKNILKSSKFGSMSNTSIWAMSCVFMALLSATGLSIQQYIHRAKKDND